MVLRISVFFGLFILVSCGPQTKKVEESTEEKPLTKQDATSLFTMRCASCHGEDGKLGVSGAKDLSISKLTDSEITSTIYNGKNGMPSFGSSFTKEQLEALVPVVKSLRK
jgi:mono/diheme cytochrome c family protein